MDAIQKNDSVQGRRLTLPLPVEKVRQGVPPTKIWDTFFTPRMRRMSAAAPVVAGGIVVLYWLGASSASQTTDGQRPISDTIENHLAVSTPTSKDHLATAGLHIAQGSGAPDDSNSTRVAPQTAAAAAPAPPKTAKEREAFDTWRGWVQERRYPAARYALERHLKSKPEDIEAWSLLADCQRRMGKWRGAISSYRTIAKLTSGDESRQALFTAGDIAQTKGDNLIAAQIFNRYLRKGGSDLPMRAEALVRLAYAYHHIGLTEESRELHREITHSYAVSTLSSPVQKMLTELSLRLEEEP